VPGVISVSVKLYGVLRRHRPATAQGAARQPFDIELSAGSTVNDLAAELDMNPLLVSAIAVNGESATEETLLQAGDQVRLFPPSAGG
jgi:molybdopterin converting factor small subunit